MNMKEANDGPQMQIHQHRLMLSRDESISLTHWMIFGEDALIGVGDWIRN